MNEIRKNFEKGVFLEKYLKEMKMNEIYFLSLVFLIEWEEFLLVSFMKEE